MYKHNVQSVNVQAVNVQAATNVQAVLVNVQAVAIAKSRQFWQFSDYERKFLFLRPLFEKDNRLLLIILYFKR